VRKSSRHETLTHFIGGEHITGTSGRFGDVFDPATGEIRARVPLASRAICARRWKQLRKSFRNGPRSIRSAAPA